MSLLSLCLRVIDRGLWILSFLQQIFVPFLVTPPRAFMDDRKNGGNGEDEQEREEKEVEEDEDRREVKAAEDEPREGEIADELEEEEGGKGDYPPEFDSDRRGSRRPFTGLSQVDADLALARRLQEQERAYMLLTMRGLGGAPASDFAGSETGSEYDLHDEDEEDENFSEGRGTVEEGDFSEDASGAHNSGAINPPDFDNDEAYARALQDEEERDVAVRLLALAGIRISDHIMEHPSNSQDAWLEVDPDELTYEELLALGDAVGTEGRGLGADTITLLPSIIYQATRAEEGTNEQCVICRLDFDDSESLIVLPCKHLYHPECINRWLQINKICPICSAEVSTNLQMCHSQP